LENIIKASSAGRSFPKLMTLPTDPRVVIPTWHLTSPFIFKVPRAGDSDRTFLVFDLNCHLLPTCLITQR